MVTHKEKELLYEMQRNCRKRSYKIYLDDIRTPIDPEWIIVRSHEEFIKVVTTTGLDNISHISLDHDLGYTAMEEYFNNTKHNYTINYDNIKEKTGLDCAKWLVEQWINGAQCTQEVRVHSANPVGSANIMGYINNYYKSIKRPQDCIRHIIPYKMENNG